MYIKGDKLEDVLAQIQHMYDIQKEKADETIPKVMKVEPINGNYGFYASNLKVRKNYYSSGQAPETVAECEHAVGEFLNTLDSSEVFVKAKIAENLPKIKNNQAIREKITLIMQELGIPNSYQERDYKSKARIPKYNTLNAGYLGDLSRNVPVSDGGAYALQAIAKARIDAAEWLKKKRAELAAKEAAAAKLKEEEREKNVLIHMRVKYDCDPEAGADEVLDAILEKNKYLDLAHHMLQTRNDWSEGFDQVEAAIYRFKIESQHDQEIFEELHDIITDEDFDRDGRVFRDTRYNYGYIYKLVNDESLVEDYNTIYNYTNN